jgi:exosome complex component RRP42
LSLYYFAYQAHVRTFWDEGTRPDGRLFTQARPTTVVSSLLKHSAGSALVKQGDTKVFVAMTTQIGQPSPDIPDHGDVVVSVSSDGHADLLQAWLQRMLDETLPPRLNLLTGKACIRLVVTVMILQDSGNLMDAALLGCMAAWKDTTLPSMQDLKEVDGKLWWKEEPTSSLSKKSPEQSEGGRDYRLSLTMGVVKAGEENQTSFLVDPTTIEAKQLEGSLTVVVNVLTQTFQVEYSGSISLSATELALAAKMASGNADELVKLL